MTECTISTFYSILILKIVNALALAEQNRQHEGLPYAEHAVDIFNELKQAENLAKAQQALQACRFADKN